MKRRTFLGVLAGLPISGKILAPHRTMQGVRESVRPGMTLSDIDRARLDTVDDGSGLIEISCIVSEDTDIGAVLTWNPDCKSMRKWRGRNSGDVAVGIARYTTRAGMVGKVIIAAYVPPEP